MLPEQLHNPEVAALGLDVEALVGKSIAEVRRLVDRGDRALVLANEDAPPGVPSEVMRKEPNVHDGKPALTWMYQTTEGEWRGWSSYIVDDDFVRRSETLQPEIIFGQIYTVRARATPGIGVRPIVQVDFDARGTCLFASDAAPQLTLLMIGAEGRRRSVHASPAQTSRVRTTSDPHLDALVEPFNLTRPVEAIVLRDWQPGGAPTSGFLWGYECELRSLILWNAQMDQRLVIGRNDAGSWWLVAVESGTTCPAINLDQRGLRVSFRSATGDVGPAFDVYAGALGVHLLDLDGDGFAASVIIAQRSSPTSTAGVESVIQILGHHSSTPAATTAVIARFLDADQRLEVSSASRTMTLDVVTVKRVPATQSILVVARPT